MPANAPNRSNGNYQLTFGMATMPISTYAGSEDSAFKRSEYAPDGTKVGRTNTVKVDDDDLEKAERTIVAALKAALEGGAITQEQFDQASEFEPVKKIDYGDIVHAVETEAGLVAVRDDELAMLDFGVEKNSAEIIRFLPLSLLGTGSYVPQDILQVRPQKVKGRSPAAKSYAILLKAMRLKACFALVEMNRLGKLCYGALMSTGRMWILKFDEEVREDLPLPDFTLVDDDNLRATGSLIDTSLGKRDVPVLNDRNVELAWELVEAKIEAKDIFVPAQAGPSPEAQEAKAGDLMATLTASVEAASDEAAKEKQ